ncbi:peptide ABC transporter substrate-binding protein [Salinibacterium sp. NSLL150]|uniref:ABC transporter substrate-binding protein n=1 Tax=unclassified Salinibacterium TaxID=2632331 RepID=UPI0018CDB930|nr:MULTISPECIES: ABC transporter substrate-binding protein [unclassified Salinibacterium]MBH0098944.1 peptide ABC transporter substrate-binding protein [Salinibacterium sp. NSLL35]MBH0101699.1 peptide ABC transporter substrate-binding protein [Salinibacterium sp. NSLL150]MBH0104458.1 peptide ABC transporter substrate-binding protein [Salinibacterium sp. NSLL16]MBH0107219.1 peptide ABC transporter substrate-binding protein [Salinibacterium sp. NSLL17]MBH0109005.1 peptide ABC transporter substra
MTSASKSSKRVLAVIAGSAAFALALTGCQAGGDSSGGGSESLIVGTTDKVTFLDPAGSYDNGSFALMNQVFPFLLNSPLGTSDVEPDIAESAEYTSDDEYTVVLKSGLTFANGNDLTSSDVKFSFDRQVAINDENGPSVLLGNIDSVEAVDDTTVVFHLKNGNDQTFAQILSSPAAPIVDEEVFSADAVTPDEEIVDGMAFAGQYVIESYDFNNIVSFTANPDYQGVLGAAATDSITLKYYTDASNLKLDVQEGNIDVAHRSLSATDVADLEGNDNVNVIVGPGGEIRYIVFNFDTQPYGAKTPEADAAKSLAVRGAVADLIDRQEISDQVYKGTYLPLYSYVPDGLTGATEVLKDLYGDGDGGPSVEAAQKRLADAGVDTPVKLNLQYNPDHYGESSGDEYALVKSQLEADGVFEVNLQSTEWVTYASERTADAYPAYQLGWFPDYSDADNYLTPFFGDGNFLGNHYADAEVNDLIVAQATELDPATREGMIEDIQAKVAAQLSTVPFLQGAQIAVTGKDVTGATLDGSFKFRYGSLAK